MCSPASGGAGTKTNPLYLLYRYKYLYTTE